MTYPPTQPGPQDSYDRSAIPPRPGAAPWDPYPSGPQPGVTYPTGYGMPGPGYPGVRGTADPDDMTLPLYSASFGAAVTRFFKGYVRFRGRASQSEYWWAQLFQVIVGIVGAVVVLSVTMPEIMSLPSSEAERLSGDQIAMLEWMFRTPSVRTVFVVVSVFGLALLLPLIALGWRRLQDANVPGGWALSALVLQALGYVPVLGALASVGGLAWWVVVGTLSTKPEGQRFDRP